MYSGQHWPACLTALQPGFILHSLSTQAKPGGLHLQASQGSSVGMGSPLEYTMLSTTQAAKKKAISVNSRILENYILSEKNLKNQLL